MDDDEIARDFAGYNLTSVLNNPRESAFDFLYETFYPTQEEFAPNIAPMADLEAITMKDFEAHLATAKLAQKFKRNRAQPMDSAVRAAAAATAMAEAEHNVIRCFETIPREYFNPNFSLEDHFISLSMESLIASGINGPKACSMMAV